MIPKPLWGFRKAGPGSIEENERNRPFVRGYPTLEHHAKILQLPHCSKCRKIGKQPAHESTNTGNHLLLEALDLRLTESPCVDLQSKKNKNAGHIAQKVSGFRQLVTRPMPKLLSCKELPKYTRKRLLCLGHHKIV